MAAEKKQKVTFTVSEIKESYYDNIVTAIETFIDEKYLDICNHSHLTIHASEDDIVE